MGFQCAIVGLPNVGKSTLFNALTSATIQAENYPFCTIEPNVGTVEVPDPRLQPISDIVKPKQTIPTYMHFVDIAGLVEGASQGEGLGNQFLANIRETEAIAHVVRCFEDDDISHVTGQLEPLKDMDVINSELILADLASAEKAVQKIRKKARSGDKQARIEADLLDKVQAHLSDNQPLRTLELADDEEDLLKSYQFITRKPTLYIANVAEDGFENNPLLDSVREQAQKESANVVAVCAQTEAEIAELDDEEKTEFLNDLGLEEPGLNRVIRAGYDLLGLQTFFTAGEKEVRAWTCPQGATAPQAAGVIHTDFEKGFIRAEVVSYEDFIHYNGEAGAKEAGKWRLEGKNYIVQDGDIMHFRFNV